ncbi:MAG: MFS transporter [Gammaproteobacteria bacterium]|nr:MFS transporter [Gammaproteobacteria bacterium]MBT5334503.1 MFS transporter [Gammaproteobacteria bacterium]MBT5683049.1 MFS transporter [Gammaproteobacteria bacterium]MBT6024008.1 MFS transporter [Gammaproteobacteria bacterium]MBT6558137.1 MFS transporter [Gammaproteobacteria bacterium]
MSQATTIGPNYRKYALGILLIGYIINFVDRSILSLLLEPIKLELALTDSQLGFLGGLAFAVFYTFLGIPIAALADRRSRVKILAVSMVIWSAMTAICGLANNFLTLLLARIGVGVGEAGASPPSHSLISDYFPIETRATALSIYALGIPLGTMIGSFVGGWGADTVGWRYTFFLVGVPGIIFAFIVWFTLREPPRGMSDIKLDAPSAPPVNTAPPPPVSTVLKLLWSKTSFRHLAFAAGLHAFVSYGAGTWNAPFFIRIHEMSLTDIGSILALIAGIGAIGTFFGGYISDKLSDRTNDKRWYFWVPGIATLVMVPFQLVAYLYGGVWVVVASLMMVAILGNAYLGPSFAMTQALVSLRMRAVASAILLFVLNLIGMGLGPYFVGVLSDILTPDFGIYSIRYAMCAAVLVNVWAACHYFIGARTMRGDLADTQEMNEKLLTEGNAA